MKRNIVIFAVLGMLAPTFLLLAFSDRSTQANLIIVHTFYAPVPGYAWEAISFTAYVKNTGGAVTGPFAMYLRIDAKGDGTWETTSSVSIRALAVGESQKIEWIGVVKLPQGTHTVRICADVDNAVAESDETDNCKSLSFSLHDWYGALPGDERALDIVFIGDRYPDMSPFYNDVATLKEYLLSREPFSEFASQIKFYIVENNTYLGCRETVKELYAPIDPPPTKPTGTSTTIVCDQSLVMEAVKKAGVPYDKIVVLASGMNGGTGFGNFVFTGKEKRLFVHELGHGFGLLDEYVSTSDSGNASDACHANCCENLRCAAWGAIPGVQCILGCTYPNWYRSSPESIMKSQYMAEYFNAVSIDHLRKMIQRYLERVPPTMKITAPANTSVVDRAVVVTVSASDDVLIAKTELYIDGELFAKWYAGEQSVSHQTTWDTALLTPGLSHVLGAKAYDLAGNVAVSGPVTMTISPVTTISPMPPSSLSPMTPPTQTPPSTQTPAPIISSYPMPLINDGDLASDEIEQKWYLAKVVGEKRFLRPIIERERFYDRWKWRTFYPHLPSRPASIYTHTGFRISAWVRLPVTSDSETWKVWEVNDDGTKHWITCADPNNCAATWIRNGGDPDGIYTVNKAEIDFYTTGSNVFLL